MTPELDAIWNDIIVGFNEAKEKAEALKDEVVPDITETRPSHEEATDVMPKPMAIKLNVMT